MVSTESWFVPDISCGHCATRIRKALSEVDGVSDVSVDVDAKTVRLTLADDAVTGWARQALVAAGYPPESE